jgi:epoxyqueuosine reductase QueG
MIGGGGMLKEIESFLERKEMDVVGVADVAGWQSPLAECRPTEILKDCKRVIVFGKEIPRPVYTAHKHAFDLYLNVAENQYHTLDALASEVASMLTREGYNSVPLGAYLPLLMRKGKYWGIVSLKHSAVRAGLGTMGKNTLLANERFGNRLRLGGLLTTAPLEAGKPLEKSLCVEDCGKCVDVCPVHALDGRGGIDQYKCLRRSIGHPLLSTAFLSQWFRSFQFVNKYFELVTGTLGARYSYTCFECLINCPHFNTGVSVGRSQQKTETQGIP